MPTLQEKKRELANLRQEHANDFTAVKSAPENEKQGILERINAREVDLGKLHNEVIRDEDIELKSIENQRFLDTLKTPGSPVLHSAQGGGGSNTKAGRTYQDPEYKGLPLDQALDVKGNLKSIGELMIDNEEYAAQLQQFAGTSAKGKAVIFQFPFKSVNEWKATLGSTPLTSYDRVPGIVILGTQMPHVADLLAQGETTQPTIRYVRENSYTNAAGAVLEGGQKPEATFDLVGADAPVRKIAVIARVTDEMFADFPAVRDYVNQRLPFMLEQKEDDELLNGNGVAPNLQGILNVPGILSGGTNNQGADTVADPIPHPILRAMTKIQALSYFEPTGVVMNPFDWQAVRLQRTGDGVNSAAFYLWGAPSEKGPGTIWGLPVVSTNTIAQKTYLVGAFRLGAQIFRRQGITIDMTNADGNDFQFNRIAIRAEMREALAIYRPQAFAKGTLQ